MTRSREERLHADADRVYAWFDGRRRGGTYSQCSDALQITRNRVKVCARYINASPEYHRMLTVPFGPVDGEHSIVVCSAKSTQAWFDGEINQGKHLKTRLHVRKIKREKAADFEDLSVAERMIMVQQAARAEMMQQMIEADELALIEVAATTEV